MNRTLPSLLLLLTACAPELLPSTAGLTEDADAFPFEVREGLYTVRMQTPSGELLVIAEEIDGELVAEGDMVLGSLEDLDVVEDRETVSIAHSFESRRWPDAVVPYTIGAGFNATGLANIQAAMDHWEANTPIRFVAQSSEANWVNFRFNGNTCSSYVGMVGNGEQHINLNRWGCSTGAAVHEIGHALGLWHEQSRSDRDQHITIHWANIQPGKEHNFNTKTNSIDLGPYDFASRMHYGAHAFSVDSSLPTITRNDGQALTPSTLLSAGDVRAVRELYGLPSDQADFDNDGHADLVVGVPGENVGNLAHSGTVNVLYGSDVGVVAAGSHSIHRNTVHVPGPPEADERLGSALAHGDFDGDGFSDLAIGAPGARVNGHAAAGEILVFYGDEAGVDTASGVALNQTSSGIGSAAAADERFGAALATGDFDGDTYLDLAVASPGNNNGRGLVHVLYGGAGGLSGSDSFATSQGHSYMPGTAQDDDHFGEALAVGDFNGDGYDDLAIGEPDEDVAGQASAGRVVVLFGGSSGVSTAGVEEWTQDSPDVNNPAAANDRFGATLAAGDVDQDGYDELYVGSPGEDTWNAIADVGGVHMLSGTAQGLSSGPYDYWRQGYGLASGAAQADSRFGSALTVADLNDDGYPDLVVGVPGLDTGAGAIHLIYGTASGPEGSIDELLTRDSAGIDGDALAYDAFGAALTSGDYDGDGVLDIAVGAPWGDDGGHTDNGTVNLIAGSSVGPVGDVQLSQSTSGTPGNAESGDEYGASLR